MDGYIKILQKSFLFSQISSEKILELLNNVKYKVEIFQKKETMVFRGDRVLGVYLLLEGHVEAEMLKSNGELQVIEALNPGDILASAFIFGRESIFPVDVIAKTSVKIIFISKEEIFKLFSLDSKIMENFLNDISNRAQFLSKRIWSNFNNKSIGEKLNSYILEIKKGDIIIFQESVKELAERFQVARPSLSRVLSNYVHEGILKRLGRNKFQILDMEYFL
ncbi:Crp/Fnr family transcriptional regulator [Cetobacterium sp. SF1]|uniref:Crp/Fnr family transcriptional regulator n=1 Tax=Cetobacterium sp. SF1 TaxID=3417654 RepID=UPI003CEAA4EB